MAGVMDIPLYDKPDAAFVNGIPISKVSENLMDDIFSASECITLLFRACVWHCEALDGVVQCSVECQEMPRREFCSLTRNLYFDEDETLR